MLDQILDILLYVPRLLFSLLVDGLIEVFNSIPVPEFMANLDLGGLGAFEYVMYLTMLPLGLSMILSALVARFLVRRIPLIG